MRVQVSILLIVLAACAAREGESTPSLEAAARKELIAQYGAEGTIRGRIVDTSGRPVTGAQLHAGVYTLSNSTPSDGDGRYLVGIGPGYPTGQDIHLSVRANGFVNARTSAPLGAREHVIVMSRGAGVRAQLVAGGEDIVGRTVTVRSRRGDLQESVLRDGRFTILGLTPDERQVLEVRVPGFVPRILPGLQLEDGDVLELGPLELDSGGTLEVVARDVFDEPVPGAGVHVIWEADLQASWFVNADEAGIARIEGVPHRVELEVVTTPPEGFGRSTSLEREVRAVTLAPDEERHLVSVLLRRPVVLRGRLVWGGAGPAPWSADRQLRIEGVATGISGERWENAGAAPDDGAPLGEQDAEFILWARPGRWDIDLVARRDGSDVSYAGRLVDLEVPEPARGERSGELDVGAVVFVPTPR